MTQILVDTTSWTDKTLMRNVEGDIGIVLRTGSSVGESI